MKLILAFLLGAVVASFVTLTAISYYAVEHLTLAKPIADEKALSKAKKEIDADVPPEDNWINANILDVLRFGDQYAAELNQFDKLKSEIISKKSPPLCEVICGVSFFDKDRMLEERTPYLKNFYRQNGARAMQDPLFQLKLRELGFLSQLFPASFRSVWVDIEQKRETNPTFAQKLAWSLKFEIAALAELSRLPSKWDELKTESDRIQSYRDIIQSCQRGLRPARDLHEDCQRL